MASQFFSSAQLSSSTPGFSFGRSGTINAGTYLQIDNVPSNLAGRIVPFAQGQLSYIFVSCEANATFDISIQTRSGVIFTTVKTISVSAARKETFLIDDVVFAFEDEVCVLISSGTVSNVVVGLIIQGNGFG